MAKVIGLCRSVGELLRDQASIAVFGNGAGMKNNRLGAEQLRRSAARTDKRFDDEQKTVLSELRSTGCASVPVVHDPGLLERLRLGANRCFDDPEKWTNCQAAAVPGVDCPVKCLKDPVKDLAEIAQLATPSVRAVIEGYIGPGAEIVETAVWRTFHIPNPNIDAYSNFWHFDRLNIAMVKLFVNLGEPVDRRSGAFRAHGVARSREISRSGYLNRSIVLGRAFRMIEAPEDVFVLEGGLGATALVNTAICLHRAGIPDAGHPRTMACLEFMSRTA